MGNFKNSVIERAVQSQSVLAGWEEPINYSQNGLPAMIVYAIKRGSKTDE